VDKLGRNYFLKVQKLEGDFVEIRPPFTMEFDIQRTILSSSNTGAIRVFNLSPDNRNQIRKDITDYDLYLQVVLQAGYGKNMPVIFQGNIKQAWSHRQKVDFITEIQSFDGGFAMVNGESNQAFIAGTPKATILRNLINDLPGVTQGTIGAFPGTLARGSSLSGRTADLLAEQSNGTFFIDNEKAHCLGESECLQGSIDVLDASSGLLGTPIREQNILYAEMMFEPRVLLGQKIELRSLTSQNFNGFYRVVSIHHRGTISESVCGDAITLVGLAYGTEGLTVIF
jgi:hypothetical protein